MNCELLVIGNGREAIDEALSVARQGGRVVLVETSGSPDSTSLDNLRQAASHLMGERPVSMSGLRAEVARLERCQRAADRAELDCLGVDVFSGDVQFASTKTLEVRRGDDVFRIQADNVVVACGTKSVRPRHIPFDGRFVVDVESLLQLEALPRSMIVVGAGDTGQEFALLLGSLGVEVTVVDERTNVFDVCGGLMGDTRLFEMQSLDIAFRLGDEVIGVETRRDDSVSVRLASGKVFVADAALICVGREGETGSLNLEAAGVGLDERGRVWCDAEGHTWASHIRAIGNIVGFRTVSA